MSSVIPTIDFERFLRGSDEGRRETAFEVDEALNTVGFFYLRNHGIEQGRIDAWFEWSRQFFDLSDCDKQALCPAPRSFNQGYFGLGEEVIRGQRSMKESFDFGDPKNILLDSWPNKKLPGFHDFASGLYKDCAELIAQLLQCVSIALGLPPESLGKYHTGSTFVSSLIHYPAIPIPRIRSGKVVRNPAHSDFGTLTLLFQRDVGGLEIADMSSTDKTSSAAVEKSGKFLHVEPNPKDILVNVGYLLMRWTNGKWKNTVHRVSEPPAHQEVGDSKMIPRRYSIAFFSFPDTETIVEPLPICCSDQEPNWAPINAGEYLLKKRVEVYSTPM